MCGTDQSDSVSFYFLLHHLEMAQSFQNGGFFFGRALWNNLVFLLGEVIVLSDGEAELAFGLGDLQAGDPEAEGVQNVSLNLIVSGFTLCGGQVGVLQVEGHTDGPIRIFSDHLNNRLTRHFFVPTPAGRPDRGGADRCGLCTDRRRDRGNLRGAESICESPLRLQDHQPLHLPGQAQVRSARRRVLLPPEKPESRHPAMSARKGGRHPGRPAALSNDLIYKGVYNETNQPSIQYRHRPQ